MREKTILVTGFEPFRGLEKNASWEAVRLLPEQVMGSPIVKRQLPVKWFLCVEELEQALEEIRPWAVLATGQGNLLPPIEIERVGINLSNGIDVDDSVDRRYEPIFYHAPAAYFSTLPCEAMHDRLRREQIPVKYSFDAGRFHCNCVLYSALHLAATRFPGMMAGFVHVPMIPDGSRDGMMPTKEVARALTCCLEEIAKVLNRPLRSQEEIKADL